MLGLNQLDAAVQIGVVDQLVEVLEPGVGIEVVEVGAHGQHDVVLCRVRIDW